MAIPSQPKHLFTQPFANSGDFATIPDNPEFSGRASLEKGFPVETQLPLHEGGVAPNRLDFNGIFNMLSAFAFWQQSGGQFTYSPKLSYTTPCLVYYEGILWWCVQDNGADTKTVAPGSNDAYWVEFLQALATMSGGSSSIGIPVGGLIMWATATPPEGFFVCDGSSFSVATYPKLYKILGSSSVPDMRGMFVRGYDTKAINDPDGKTRTILSTQDDAGRNITGRFMADDSQRGDPPWGAPEGAFSAGERVANYDLQNTSYNSFGGWLNFDASKSWGEQATSTEFRPKNVSVLFCIKHD